MEKARTQKRIDEIRKALQLDIEQPITAIEIWADTGNGMELQETIELNPIVPAIQENISKLRATDEAK